MKILAIIPARLNSTRLPKKVLREINGKSIVRRVFEQASKCNALHKVIVAVDSLEVADHLNHFNVPWMMTNIDHVSGTDRCAEVLRENPSFTHIINIQGDEPFIDPGSISQLVELLQIRNTQIASLMKPIQTLNDFINPNVVKIVVNTESKALYFSRSNIPHQRGKEIEELEINSSSYRHIGIYGFEANTLLEITKLPPGKLEKIEMLEQLRWLENCYSIRMGISNAASIGIDTEEDLQKATEYATKLNL